MDLFPGLLVPWWQEAQEVPIATFHGNLPRLLPARERVDVCSVDRFCDRGPKTCISEAGSPKAIHQLTHVSYSQGCSQHHLMRFCTCTILTVYAVHLAAVR